MKRSELSSLLSIALDCALLVTSTSLMFQASADKKIIHQQRELINKQRELIIELSTKHTVDTIVIYKH